MNVYFTCKSIHKHCLRMPHYGLNSVFIIAVMSVVFLMNYFFDTDFLITDETTPKSSQSST